MCGVCLCGDVCLGCVSVVSVCGDVCKECVCVWHLCVGKEWGCVRRMCVGMYVWGVSVWCLCVWGCMYRVCLCVGKEWECMYMGVYEGVYTDSYGAVEEGDGIGAVGVRRGCRGGNGHPHPAPRPALTCWRERGRRCPHARPSPPAAAMAPPVPAPPRGGAAGVPPAMLCVGRAGSTARPRPALP